MYKDRGIIKWAPFDALIGFQALMADITYRLGKQAKPVLSEDQIEDINRQLAFAIQSQAETEIEYYVDGYFKTSYGRVHKVDVSRHVLCLHGGIIIDLYDVLSLQASGYEATSY